MAKHGQHNNDQDDNDKSRGPNNPRKSVTVTAGNVKKKETYDEQAREHDDAGKPAQAQQNEWTEDTRDPRREAMRALDAPKRARQGDLDGNRSGSRSNAS